jgi:hypothetical protein
VSSHKGVDARTGRGEDAGMNSSEVVSGWPEESREAAQLVIDKYGEPDEVTPTQLTWFDVGEWKRVVATKAFWEHQFPAPHFDSVESIIDYQVPPSKFSDLARFDGSVVAKRTVGELSATCHDEEANRLALNLAHEIVAGRRDVDAAREYYAKEFLDARRKQPTPYMERFRFEPKSGTPDGDRRVLSDDELEKAQDEGSSES